MSAPVLLSADAALDVLLARCRRRAALVLFVRYSVVACAISFGVAAAVRFIASESIGATSLSLFAFASGMLSAVVAGVRRYPTLREVASTLDRHLRIDDSMVAALQARRTSSTTAVASLVVRHAVQRTAGLDPRNIFPMELQRRAAMLVAAVLLVAVPIPRGSNELDVRGGGRSTSSGAVGAPAATRAQQQQSGPPEQMRRGSSTRSDDGTRAGAEPQTIQRSASESVEPSASSASPDSAQPGRNSGTGKSTSQSRQADAAGTLGEHRAADADRNSKGTGIARGSALGDSGGTGGGAGTGGPRGTGSGGVRTGNLLTSSSVAPLVAQKEAPARDGRAKRNAEAALTRGDIPPELREYVRAYFRAITR